MERVVRTNFRVLALAAVAAGELTPSDASEISKLIDVYVETFKTTELTNRLTELEKKIAI